MSYLFIISDVCLRLVLDLVLYAVFKVLCFSQVVLRNEWVFKGMIITDYTENGTLQDANQQFRAGGNYILASSNFSDPGQNNATNRFKWRLRESAKQVIYGTLRPLYDNDVYNSDTSHKAIISSSKAPYVWWKPLLHCAEALVIVAFAYGCIVFLLPSRVSKKENGEPSNEDVATDTE